MGNRGDFPVESREFFWALRGAVSEFVALASRLVRLEAGCRAEAIAFDSLVLRTPETVPLRN